MPGVFGVIALAPNIGFAPPKGRVGDIADTCNQTKLEWTLGALQGSSPVLIIAILCHDAGVNTVRPMAPWRRIATQDRHLAWRFSCSETDIGYVLKNLNSVSMEPA